MIISQNLVDSGIVLVGEIKAITPVKTGRLKASIKYTVDNSKTISVSSDVPYAVFVEYGTPVMEPRSMFRRGIASARDKIIQLWQRNVL